MTRGRRDQLKRLPSAAMAVALGLGLAAVSPAAHAEGGLASRSVVPEVGRLDAAAQTQAGAYLAGSFAVQKKDLDSAVRYLLQALSFDLDNAHLQRRAFTVALAGGRMAEAVDLARRVVERDPSDPLSRTALAVDALRGNRPAAALEHLQALEKTGISRFVQPLLAGWAQAGQGDAGAALDTLQAFIEIDGLAALGAMHKALILDGAGESEAARAAYETALEGSDTVRLVLSAGAFFEEQGDIERARAVYDGYQDGHPYSVIVAPARERLEQGLGPQRPINGPVDGAAEALFQIASLIQDEGANDLAQIYTRLALHLRPDFALAQILIGDLLSDQDRHDDALDVLAAVPAGTPVAWSARLRMAEALEDLERLDDAGALLETMAGERPDNPEPLIRLGDLHRANERFDQAVAAYDRAFERAPERLSRDWTFLYRRGIALERARNWERAEADLLAAVEIEPEHASLLNYLGYSWIDRGEHLDRAEEMVRKAVEMMPNDGYIVDSLGWVYFRTGRLDEAVVELERAAALRPGDAVINDHLGDAYWMVGRRTEARFQWRKALRDAEERDLILAIEDKLANGLVDPAILSDAISRDGTAEEQPDPVTH